MTHYQLIAAQVAMVDRHPRRTPRVKTHAMSAEGRREAAAFRATQPPQDKPVQRTEDERAAKKELKGAMHMTRAMIRKRAGVQRRAYRNRKVRFNSWNQSIREAWRAVLLDWKELNKEIQLCKETLQRLRTRSEVQRALGVSEGYQMGREAALREVADQQSYKKGQS